MHASGADDVADTVWHTNLVSYFHVCAAAFLIYDYALTFRQEVEHVWGSRLNVAKILFFLTRYSAFLDITIMLSYQFVKNPSVRECSFLFKLSGWLVVWGLALSELLIILRTWALWSCDRRIGIGLGLLLTTCHIIDCVAFAKFMRSLTFEPMKSFLSHVDRGCVVTGGSRILVLDCAVLIAFDTLIVVLIFINVLRNRHVLRSNSKLINTLYRDGFLLYIYLFAVSLANLVIVLVASAEYTNLLASVQRVLYAILPSRILLNLRQASQVNGEPTSRWSQVLGPGVSFVRDDSDDDIALPSLMPARD